jgi:hypothetical protein
LGWGHLERLHRYINYNQYMICLSFHDPRTCNMQHKMWTKPTPRRVKWIAILLHIYPWLGKYSRHIEFKTHLKQGTSMHVSSVLVMSHNGASQWSLMTRSIATTYLHTWSIIGNSNSSHGCNSIYLIPHSWPV